MKLTEFDIQISKENVCRLIQADPDSNVYQEIMAALQEMLPTAYEKLKPTALLEFGDFETYAGMIEEEGIEEALYGITTVGEEIGSWSTQLFREGNYLGGMLADAIADDCLFQMDEAISENCLLKKKIQTFSHRDIFVCVCVMHIYICVFIFFL